MNILILSCGTRNKLMRYFKEPGNGIDRVVGADCSGYAPALYEADAHYLVPRMTSPDYPDILLDICRREKIDAVLPLQEDELFLIASHRQKFTDAGILPVVSEKKTVELCRDKYAFYQHMKQNGLPVLPSCLNVSEFQKRYENGEMEFPVFIKPVRGCGSIGVQKVDNIELLSVLCKYSSEDMLIQQFAEGDEYGVDLYVDMLSHMPVSVFIKKKLRMRAGETEKSISVKEEALFDLIRKTAASLSLSGPVDMDVFCVNGNYYLSEINPRFGGGYPHAHACGINFPKFIANNVAGRENTDAIGHYEEGICMLKYTDLMTLRL
ncbi:MAG: ATP-grasp domain-containing protein [Blautia sp.]|nr:ATP-grasp domain-containing protein [Blautia sp.]MCM1200868.1 ATP-grasp domain-containing protein [Bacteroides fragilis]